MQGLWHASVICVLGALFITTAFFIPWPPHDPLSQCFGQKKAKAIMAEKALFMASVYTWYIQIAQGVQQWAQCVCQSGKDLSEGLQVDWISSSSTWWWKYAIIHSVSNITLGWKCHPQQILTHHVRHSICKNRYALMHVGEWATYSRQLFLVLSTLVYKRSFIGLYCTQFFDLLNNGCPELYGSSSIQIGFISYHINERPHKNSLDFVIKYAFTLFLISPI